MRFQKAELGYNHYSETYGSGLYDENATAKMLDNRMFTLMSGTDGRRPIL